MSDDDAEKKDNELPQESSEDEEEDEIDDLTSFPGGGGKRYLLHRASGCDVLENVFENEIEGYLEIDKTNETAMLYVKFPSDKGVIAGRLDHTGPRGQGPVKYFHLSACKAHIDYGDWEGMIYRDGITAGAPFMGSVVTYAVGVHSAAVGREDVTAENPFFFSEVHAGQLMKDQPEIDEGTEDEYPQGYTVMKKGYLAFTVFFGDEKRNYGSGLSAPVPLCLWFRPQLPDDTSCIPRDVLEEIKKLPALKRREEAAESTGSANNANETKSCA